MSFRLFIYYCALCGGWAAFLTWGLVRFIAQTTPTTGVVVQAALRSGISGAPLPAAISFVSPVLHATVPRRLVGALAPAAATVRRAGRATLAAGVRPFAGRVGGGVKGERTLLAGQAGIEAQWRCGDGIIDGATPVHEYDRGTWGPAEAERIIARSGGWHQPQPQPQPKDGT